MASFGLPFFPFSERVPSVSKDPKLFLNFLCTLFFVLFLENYICLASFHASLLPERLHSSGAFTPPFSLSFYPSSYTLPPSLSFYSTHLWGHGNVHCPWDISTTRRLFSIVSVYRFSMLWTVRWVQQNQSGRRSLQQMWKCCRANPYIN